MKPIPVLAVLAFAMLAGCAEQPKPSAEAGNVACQTTAKPPAVTSADQTVMLQGVNPDCTPSR